MTHHIPFLRYPGRLTAALLSAILAACGGSSPPPVDPLASFKQQKLDWQVCDPAVLDNNVVPYLEQLGDRARCALMRAPRDYANPAQEELKVALLRVSAEQPQRRAGLILFNPGGPGGDGLGLAPKFGALWSGANPANPSGKTLKDLSERYDLIGFSPRGLGASTQLTCSSDEQLEDVNNFSIDRSPENLRRLQHNARLEAQACRKEALAEYIHTDATARDMDLMRAVLGDDKLNYIGYSYGTWLGAWYASLFPERVGRMLLDSSMNVAGSFDDAALLTEMGRQRVFDEMLAPHAALHPDRFGLGNDAAGVRAALSALSAQLRGQVLDTLNFNRAESAASNLLLLSAAQGLQTLLTAAPNASESEIKTAIATHRFSGDETNADVRKRAVALAKNYFNPPMQPQTVALGPTDAVYLSVVCNDTATRGNEEYWIDIGNDYAARYPVAGGAATKNPCLYWGGPVAARPSLAAAAKAGPLLILQSRYDAATPIEGAQASRDALPNASMIVVENEYSHGVFPYGDGCVDPQVGAYFANGTLPLRGASCAGKPLPLDPLPENDDEQGEEKQTRAQKQDKADAASSYRDPARAEEIMRSIHREIGKANRRF
ncbi:MAG: alpha/beta hydrolase [Burkholderiaceae bacterium]